MSVRSALVAAGVPSRIAAAEAPRAERAMRERDIVTQRRGAFFLAQVLHESGGLRYFEEIASGAAYEGRRDLGNVRPGDGRRYKGRGPIQLTGRANYRTAGRALGLPLEARPDLAARHDVGWRIAAWYWSSRGLNALADRGDFVGVTRRINGGTNGLADRRRYLALVSRHDCRPVRPVRYTAQERRSLAAMRSRYRARRLAGRTAARASANALAAKIRRGRTVADRRARRLTADRGRRMDGLRDAVRASLRRKGGRS